MHDIPDTEEADAAAERYWPDGFKHLIRERLGNDFKDTVLKNSVPGEDLFNSFFEKHYAEKFSDYDHFLKRLCETVVIGAENGADEAFNEIYEVMYHGLRLSKPLEYAKYFQPEPFTVKLREEVCDKIIGEYGELHAYEHFYEDRYSDVPFSEFMREVGEFVVSGAVKGADRSLEKIYQAFMFGSPLTVFRRHPRRVR